MTVIDMHGPRITLSAADVWADPDASWNAFIEVCCRPLDELSPLQRPVALVWRYTGEINNGGHLQYFVNLEDRVEAVVPDTLAGWRMLGCYAYADILDRAYLRWTAAARLAPADLVEYSAVAHENEFDDLDNAFYALNIGSKGGDESWDALQRHFREHADRYVVLAQPTTANDHMLLGLGDPSVQPDGGLAVWRTLAENENPRVRLRAARHLLPLDREIAVRTLKALDADQSVPILVRSNAGTWLFTLEREPERRGQG